MPVRVPVRIHRGQRGCWVSPFVIRSSSPRQGLFLNQEAHVLSRLEARNSQTCSAPGAGVLGVCWVFVPVVKLLELNSGPLCYGTNALDDRALPPAPVSHICCEVCWEACSFYFCPRYCTMWVV